MNELHIWTVYDHPTDFPNEFVARLFVIRAEAHGPTDKFVTGSTLEEVRSKIPQGLHRMDRQPEDDAKIVESWI